MALHVRFWGVRGSIPVPGLSTRRYGGNTACVEVRSDQTRFVLDAGSGLRELGLAMAAEPGPDTIHLLISHAHWDHIQGFPFFVPAYQGDTRIHVYDHAGPESARDMHRLLSGQMHSDYFPVQFAELGAEILRETLTDAPHPVDGVEISLLPVFHPGGCLSFRLREQASGATVVYATDCELDKVIVNQSDDHPTAGGPLRLLPEEVVDFVRGADLLIIDGQYGDEEYAQRVGWGHSRATTAVDLAVQAGVRQAAIFHHDPMQSDLDVEAKLDACRRRAAELGSTVQVFAAREGVELRLG